MGELMMGKKMDNNPLLKSRNPSSEPTSIIKIPCSKGKEKAQELSSQKSNKNYNKIKT